jgi:hypothetical protein
MNQGMVPWMHFPCQMSKGIQAAIGESTAISVDCGFSVECKGVQTRMCGSTAVLARHTLYSLISL